MKLEDRQAWLPRLQSSMKLLLLTNLYPPQELGGYGRSMQDFAWGLSKRGHCVSVLTSDAPYLEEDTPQLGNDSTKIKRLLKLKGSYEKGFSMITNQSVCRGIDSENNKVILNILNEERFDGILLGNIDLLGHEIITPMLNTGIKVCHHIGFVAPPFSASLYPTHSNYHMMTASYAVRKSLVDHGLPVADAEVIYPGARCDLFGENASSRSLPEPLGHSLGSSVNPLGSKANPLRLCFAGIFMETKGAHTVAESLIHLKKKRIHTYASFAGCSFQADYKEAIHIMLKKEGLESQTLFAGQLTRSQLARFFNLQHVAIFPSIYPEAFGIVGAEAMASGIVLVSSGAGGAYELIENGVSGLLFKPGSSESLSNTLEYLTRLPADRIKAIAQAGKHRVHTSFSVQNAAKQIEEVFQATSVLNNKSNRGVITL